MKKNKRTIHIVVMGGNIVGAKGADGTEYQDFNQRQLEQILRQLAGAQEMDTNIVCLKNSDQITEEDRRVLAVQIEGESVAMDATYILVLHGTLTAKETQEYLHAQAARFPRALVVIATSFGTLWTQDGEGTVTASDALCALASGVTSLTQSDRTGVHILANADLWAPGTVQLNADQNAWEPVEAAAA